MSKVYVLGAFGYRTTLFDGQTIKTRNLKDLVAEKLDCVDYYDTQDFQYNKFSIICMLWKAIRCKYLFYLPAENNLRIIFPIIYFLSKIFRYEIHYFVVGGWLVEFLQDKPSLARKLNRIAGIHCETHLMKGNLETKYKYNNVDVFPNFRINDFVPKKHHTKGTLKVVFMARILKQKGLDTIFTMGDEIIKHDLQSLISVDFYGPMMNLNDDEAFFKENIKNYDFMNYFGPLEPKDIYTTLEKYDVMILPTHFYTEGLPGSILDAYISGIPVVVTNWKHATEFVDDGKCGVIIPFDDDGHGLYNSIYMLLNNSSMLDSMKSEARNRWHDFSSEHAWELIKNYIRI